MNDRSLLVLLVIIVAFVLYVKPAQKNIELMQARSLVLDSQIAAQEAIKGQQKDIDKRLKSTRESISANESYLYPAGKSSSLALVDLQDVVKKGADAHRLEIMTSTWGEPAVDAKSGLVKIPMMITLKGGPSELEAFLLDLLHGRRYIKVDRATISRYQDQQLLVNLSIVAFKQDVPR